MIRSALRPLLYRSEKIYQRLHFLSVPAPVNNWPILLGMSFPKSGTHLLDQILVGFSRFAPFSLRLHSFYAEFEGESGRKHTLRETSSWLNSLRPGDIASAHLFAHSELLARICSPDFVPYFIYRDLRDVAVSHVFYVTDIEPNHVHHDFYSSLPDFDSRLLASILGRPGEGIEFPDIASRFKPYLGWLDQTAVLKIRFEDLVNDRLHTLELILDRFLTRVPLAIPKQELLEGLEKAINPSRSPTYRSGQAGEWKKYFKQEHKRALKEVAGDLLIRLGYEQNMEW